MSQNSRILFLPDTSRGFGRGVLTGFSRYSTLHRGWTFLYRPPRYVTDFQELVLDEFRQMNLDGILCSLNQAELLGELGLPMVCYDVGNYKGPIPCITTDDVDVGRQAATFLIQQGHRNFAYFGYDALTWSKARRTNFIQTIEAAGFSVHTLPVKNQVVSLATEEEELRHWISQLPKPVALYCSNDDRALSIVEICSSMGLRIPEEIAILGTDNDELLCNTCNPPLSSVRISADQAGYDAAALLAEMIEGKAVAEGQEFPASVAGISERQSTNLLMVEHATVRKALHFIRDNVHRPVQVAEVVKDSGRSHRALNDLFHSELGCSIGKSITQARIQHISRLLTDTNLRIQEIAIAVGYDDDRHFSRYFKRSTGVTPLEYRRTVKMP